MHSVIPIIEIWFHFNVLHDQQNVIILHHLVTPTCMNQCVTYCISKYSLLSYTVCTCCYMYMYIYTIYGIHIAN